MYILQLNSFWHMPLTRSKNVESRINVSSKTPKIIHRISEVQIWLVATPKVLHSECFKNAKNKKQRLCKRYPRRGYKKFSEMESYGGREAILINMIPSESEKISEKDWVSS